METIILQCNERNEPDVRDWIKQIREELREGESAGWLWSCGKVRKIQVGDRVFLQRTGEPPRGYFASGYTIAALEEEQLKLQEPAYEDLSEAYHTTFYGDSFKICFEIETIVDYDSPLEIDYLKQLSQFEGCNFTRFGGGTAFTADYTVFLEEEWKKHSLKLSRSGQGTRLIDTYCLQGMQALKEQKFDEAYDLYADALALDLNYPQARIGLGNALYSLGKFNEAITEYTQAVLLNSKFDKAAYFKRGLAYSKTKSYDSAIEDYRKAIGLDPNFFEAHFRLGDLYYKVNQHEVAINSYSEAIKLDGSQARVYINRGKAYNQLSQIQNAREDWQKALAINPNLLDKITPLLDSLDTHDLADPISEGFIKILSKSEDGTELFLSVGENTPTNEVVHLLEAEYKNLPEKEREAVVKARIGQEQFRKKVIEYWDTCAVTGCRECPLLRASHIKPWAKCNVREALDPFNGLLLIPSLDAALDAGYISFDDSGEILVSATLNNNDAKALGIHSSLRLKQVDSKHLLYLAYHRLNIFKQ
jgi:tetratricopeptide (TPR) repeat protein